MQAVFPNGAWLNNSILSSSSWVLIYSHAVNANGKTAYYSTTRWSQEQLKEHTVQVTETLVINMFQSRKHRDIFLFYNVKPHTLFYR